jgi:hypothetical protein
MSREHWHEAILAAPHRFLRDIDPALMEQTLDIPKRQPGMDLHHHGTTDGRGRGLEIFRQIRHPVRQRNRNPALKETFPLQHPWKSMIEPDRNASPPRIGLISVTDRPARPSAAHRHGLQ